MEAGLIQTMIAKQPTKAHILCPTPKCECAISFDHTLIARDFSLVEGKTYKYFGAVNPADNLTCKYCERQMVRGDIVALFLPTSVGPVYRSSH